MNARALTIPIATISSIAICGLIAAIPNVQASSMTPTFIPPQIAFHENFQDYFKVTSYVYDQDKDEPITGGGQVNYTICQTGTYCHELCESSEIGSNGEATCNFAVNEPAGNYTVVASYSGTPTYLPSSTSENVIVTYESIGPAN